MKLYLIISGIVLGLVVGFLAAGPSAQYFPNSLNLFVPQKQIFGFLPYGLLDKADKDYSKYITTLAYFSLTIDTDGSILKLSKPGEKEPGWYALESGKLDSVFNKMRRKNIKLSLVIYNGDDNSIYPLIADPVNHADNLVNDVAPVMKKYGFKDLNLDIESPNEATDEAREKFTEFTNQVKKGLEKNQLGSLSLDISPTAFIKKYLIDPASIKKTVDTFFIMAYDFHFPGSFVTGPVAPLYGAGTVSEFDTDVAIKQALMILPKQKIVLGLPLYGYEWETITDFPRSATIPGSSLIISNRRAEQFLTSCATCSAQTDNQADEQYLIYQDQDAGTFHQAFYPDKAVTDTKLDYAKKMDLGGVGFWALGYEGSNILDSLNHFK